MTQKYEEIKAEEDSVRENIFLLRRTVGSLMWLDSLTDEEFCLIQNEIINVFIEHSKKFRSESCGPASTPRPSRPPGVHPGRKDQNMVSLKMKVRGKWWLVSGPEFSEEELAPLIDQMERAKVAILKDGERVGITFQKYTKEEVLDALKSS